MSGLVSSFGPRASENGRIYKGYSAVIRNGGPCSAKRFDGRFDGILDLRSRRLKGYRHGFMPADGIAAYASIATHVR